MYVPNAHARIDSARRGGAIVPTLTLGTQALARNLSQPYDCVLDPQTLADGPRDQAFDPEH